MDRVWSVHRHRGRAAELHALPPPDDGRRHVWVLEATAPAVVLGSTQPEDDVDVAAAAAAGVDVVRRRSGGGAVWVAPGDPLWVDVVVPRDDPLWDDDVGRAFVPVGRGWAAALGAVGVTGATVHEGPLEHTVWSRQVCFAGRGPGEVFLDGRKLVGISQRRSRAGARFQCAVPLVWDPEPLRRLLRPAPAVGALDDVATGVGDLDAGALIDAFAAALP